MHNYENFKVPAAASYKEALRRLSLPPARKRMLRAHHGAPNRCVTYTELAVAGGYDTHRAANSQYGALGRLIGDALGMQFITVGNPERSFTSSAIGCEFLYAAGEFQLMMHHELAKALDVLTAEGWFDAIDTRTPELADV